MVFEVISESVIVGAGYFMLKRLVGILNEQKERGEQRDEQIDELFSRTEDCKKTTDVAAIPN